MANPITGQVRTSLGEPLRWCPSCWKEKVEKGGTWLIKPRQVRRWKCAECRAKEKPGAKAA